MTLSLTQAGCRYGETTILEHVSVTLGAGCTALVGPNGAGKSTLLRLCSGEGRYLRHLKQTGDILLDDKPIADWPLDVLARRRALLPQQHADQLHGKVCDIMCLAMYPHRGGGARATALYEEALSTWELDHLAQRHYDGLSGGERQRVQLARTWIQMRLHPLAQERLWLLDEPQTALDLSHQRQLRTQLQHEGSSGACVVFSTHDINFALRTADRLIALKQGRLCAEGRPEDFADPALLQSVFDVPFTIARHPTDGRPWVIAE